MAGHDACAWAGEIAEVLTGWGVRAERVGVDCLDYHGFSALQAIRPGVSEHELLGVFYRTMVALGGECSFSRLRPSRCYAELAANLPAYPEAYRTQRYPYVLHGVGTDDEPPFLLFPDDPAARPEGAFEENMVVSVECYAGKVGEQDGVELEDEVLITADGPVLLSVHPYAQELLA